jgi:hypothetical protein
VNILRSRTLQSRAAQLRRQSRSALPPLAIAYRRRAAELEMEAALLAPPSPAALRGAAA